ncbi:TrmH family RNA methyltransferase [Dokdonia sp.]|uniref:TrmH family RNA methyltransferase n=1 Tax=Dokdonia sp. TaxID=2024995 RepID=UPI003262EF81
MDNNQLTHESHKNSAITRDIILLCDHVKSPANIGAIFRLADAFAVSEVIFCGTNIDLTSSRLKKTARNTQENVRFHESETPIKKLKELHTKGYTSIALEITSQSMPIHSFDVTVYDKLVLAIGDERHGISPEVLNSIHHTLHIPMYGHNSSMNVAQATAIALYNLRVEVTK